MTLLELFCLIDDFCKEFEPRWNQLRLEAKIRQRASRPGMALSEIMTIIVSFYQSSYREFKNYYNKYICKFKRSEFPKLVSYNRFVELMK